MRIFDLHCDTLYECATKQKSIFDGELEINIVKAKNTLEQWIECFAVWIPDEIRGEDAFELFKSCEKVLSESKLNRIENTDDLESAGAILTVEGGSACAGSLERLEELYRSGVRMMTLTWNGENELGFGSGRENAPGLKKFGISAVKKMDELGMIVDVSHLSDRGFYDVAEIAQKPFAASHSNLRSITDVPRNLTEEQFKMIRDSGGIVGLNFHRYFLNEDGKPTEDDLLRHIDRFLELDGGKTLCVGSDFDGCELPEFIKDITSLEDIREMLDKRGYSEELIDDIFFNNAHRFFKKML